MVYKLRSRYFISSARIMVSIKQEEQEVTFHTAPPPPPPPQGPYLTTNCFSRRWENEKTFWAWQFFFIELVSVSGFGLDSISAARGQTRFRFKKRGGGHSCKDKWNMVKPTLGSNKSASVSAFKKIFQVALSFIICQNAAAFRFSVIV